MNDETRDTVLIRPLQYALASAQEQGARHQYDYASTALERAGAAKRCAELASQSFASVAGGKLYSNLGELSDREREIGIAFARYAVHGRTF